MAVRPIGAEIELTRPAAVAGRASFSTVVARFARKKPLGAIGGVLMIIMALTAVFADVLDTYDPIATDAAATRSAIARHVETGRRIALEAIERAGGSL